MLYLGFDLSLTCTGVIVLNERGTVIYDNPIIPPKYKNIIDLELDRTRRLNFIYHSIGKICHDLWVDNITSMRAAIEGYSHGSDYGRETSGEVGGVARVALLRSGINFEVFAPTSIKKFATGKGNTPKDNVMKDVFRKWGYNTSNNNQADAYVIARLLKDVTLIKSGRADIGIYKTYEQEVIETIIHPSPKKRKSKKGTL